MNCSEVIRERRSIRKYKENVTIPQEDFERMLEAAMMAPSACNTRPWQFFVVINREMIAKLREAHPFTKMLSTASAAIVVCGRPDLQEIQETIERMRDEVTNKIDWTKAWSKKYPILESYQKEVNITYYAEALCKLLIRLEKEYGYDELNSMLVLKDILATVWKKRSEKKS